MKIGKIRMKMDEKEATSRRRVAASSGGGTAAFLATAFFAAAFLAAAFLAAAEAVPLTWDEGDAFNRAERVAGWSRAVGVAVFNRNNDKIDVGEGGAPDGENNLNLAALFSDAGIAAGWPCAIYREGHPGGYPIVIAAGKGVATYFFPFLSEKVAFRLGGIVLFALALTAVFYRITALFGRFVGVAAVVGIATIPRVFGHSLLAGGDSLLISSWLFAWVFFEPTWNSRRGVFFWGCAVGASFAAKFSGFAVVAPFLLANLAVVSAKFVAKKNGVGTGTNQEIRRIALRTTIGLGLAVAVFFAANPPLWARPISGFATFFELNCRRDGFEIPIFFLGKLYSPSRPLPWWNGFFWLATTIPTPLLLFAALAIGKTAFDAARRLARLPKCRLIDEDNEKKRARFWAATTALALGATLPIVRAFPGTPPHDGARLLIASFPFWGILAGIGAGFCVERRFFAKRTPRFLVKTAIVAAFCVGFGDLFFSAPQYLSFYNATLGGVEGATRRGMEPTYYWDAFDAKAVAFLNGKIDAARKAGRPNGVLFGAFSSQTLDYYRRWGILETAEISTISAPNVFNDCGKFGFYVLQRRPSGLTALDLELMKSARPMKRTFVRNPWNGDRKVVVLEIYDFRDVERALEKLEKNARSATRTKNGESTS